MQEKNMTSLAKKLTLAVAGLLLSGVVTVGGIDLTCSSWFCITCHEMKELGNNWRFSKHGPYNPNNPEMHNCLKCHAQPGLVGLLKAKVSGLFSLSYHLGGNYHVEATQPVVCIRGGCHQLEDLDRANRPNRTVALNHSQHVKVMQKVGTRSHCMPCHRNIAHGEDSYLPNMRKDCFLTCHTAEGITSSKCTSCHPVHPDVRLEGRSTPLLALHKDANVTCLECHAGLCKASENTCDECHAGNDYGNLITFLAKKTEAIQ
ncbi:MAG: NapC/NirT family cytochrome c [bacterium]